MQLSIQRLAESMPDDVADLVQRSFGQTPLQFVSAAADVAEATGTDLFDVIDEVLFVASMIAGAEDDDIYGGDEDEEEDEQK